MPIEQVRVLTIYLFSAVLGSLITGEFSMLQASLYLGLLLPLWTQMDLARVRKWVLWRILIYVSFTQFILSRVFGIYFETALFTLIFISIAYELYGEPRNVTPIRLLSVLSFLFMLAQSRQNAGILAFVSLVLYLFGLIFFVYCFHNRIFPVRGTYLEFFRKSRACLIHLPFLLVASFLLFWIMPRPPIQGNPMLGTKAAEYVSGFSDNVSLTDIGVLKLSDKHMMNVTPLDGVLHNPYIKGKIYNHYFGGNWQSSLENSNHFFSDKMEFKRKTKDNAKLYRYRVDLEPMQNSLLFFSNELVQIDNRKEGIKIGTVGQEIYQVERWRMMPNAFSYVFTSAETGGTKHGGGDDVSNLQLPRGSNYLKDYGDQILAGRSVRDRADLAELLKAHFRKEFSYTLEINMPNKVDPIHYFLIEQKRGHCELFASSMVLLLRAQGVPARLVTGFLIQDDNPNREFYAVTEASAHAWVEFMNESGRWQTLDPTPPSFNVVPNWYTRSRQHMNWLWHSYVILWDYDLQMTAVASALERMAALLETLRAHPFWLITPAALLLALWWSLRYLWRRLRPEAWLALEMRRLEETLERLFGAKPTRMTWLEHLRGLEGEERAGMERFFQSYWRLRFGLATAGSNRRQRAWELAREAESWSRRLRARHRPQRRFFALRSAMTSIFAGGRG